VGGGNVAVDVARTAVRAGGEAVSMFTLEQRNELPAADDEIDEALEESITLNCGWGPKEILTKGGKVSGVVFKKCVSVFDANHRFAPKYDENDTMTVEADFVLAAIGQSVEWGGLLEGTAIETNRNGTAKADSWTYQTGEPDIFVGGDVYSGPKFAIDAIAAGKEGADSLHRASWDGHSLTPWSEFRGTSLPLTKTTLLLHLMTTLSDKRLAKIRPRLRASQMSVRPLLKSRSKSSPPAA